MSAVHYIRGPFHWKHLLLMFDVSHAQAIFSAGRLCMEIKNISCDFLKGSFAATEICKWLCLRFWEFFLRGNIFWRRMNCDIYIYIYCETGWVLHTCRKTCLGTRMGSCLLLFFSFFNMSMNGVHRFEVCVVYVSNLGRKREKMNNNSFWLRIIGNEYTYKTKSSNAA